jgi:hypothetical protein
MSYVPPGWVTLPNGAVVSPQYAAAVNTFNTAPGGRQSAAAIPTPQNYYTSPSTSSPSASSSKNPTYSGGDAYAAYLASLQTGLPHWTSSGPLNYFSGSTPAPKPAPAPAPKPAPAPAPKPAPAPAPTPPPAPTPAPAPTPPPAPTISPLQQALLNPPGLRGAGPGAVGSSGGGQGSTQPTKGGTAGGPPASASGGSSAGSPQPQPGPSGTVSGPKDSGQTPWGQWGARASVLDVPRSQLANTLLDGGGVTYGPGGTAAGFNRTVGDLQSLQKQYGQTYADMLRNMTRQSGGVANPPIGI